MGGDVGFRDLATEADVGNVVAVVEMEEGAVVDGEREIERPAAVGVELDVGGVEATVRVIADFVFREKRMALAGGFHVVIAVELDADSLAGG